jgi:Ca-activated chloride channel family protein
MIMKRDKMIINCRNIKPILIILWIMSVITLSSYGQGERKFIRQGNRKYSDGKYPDSEILYRKAIDKNKLSQDALFNVGDALYKQKKYEEAGKVFLDNSTATIDNKKKADSYFNLGNSLVNNNKLEESINAYKNSLRLNPDNMEAKYNLAYAQDKLTQQENQKKNDKKKKDEEPSDYAKRLKAEADKLIAQGNFVEAYNLMQNGLKKDKTVNFYREYIDKTGKVAEIDVQIK